MERMYTYYAEYAACVLSYISITQMYLRALACCEKAHEPDHILTLSTANNVDNLYATQEKLAETEQMYMKAPAGKGKALRPNYTSTLGAVNNLGYVKWVERPFPHISEIQDNARQQSCRHLRRL